MLDRSSSKSKNYTLQGVIKSSAFKFVKTLFGAMGYLSIFKSLHIPHSKRKTTGTCPFLRRIRKR